MFVNRDYRGREIGTAQKLLEISLNWAITNGIRKIYLGTTPQFLAAHRFYEKNGFKEISKRDLPKIFPIMKVDTKFYKYVL
jgi:GNAT superfamily N-acetyltransferase